MFTVNFPVTYTNVPVNSPVFDANSVTDKKKASIEFILFLIYIYPWECLGGPKNKTTFLSKIKKRLRLLKKKKIKNKNLHINEHKMLHYSPDSDLCYLSIFPLFLFCHFPKIFLEPPDVCVYVTHQVNVRVMWFL